MQSITLPAFGTFQTVACSRHKHSPLTSLTFANGQWTLYGVTARHYKFWKHLPAQEKARLARRGMKSCFYCVLDVEMSDERELSERLYRNLVRSLLAPPRAYGRK